jgi:hypothetical protein
MFTKSCLLNVRSRIVAQKLSDLDLILDPDPFLDSEPDPECIPVPVPQKVPVPAIPVPVRAVPQHCRTDTTHFYVK